MIRDSGNLPYIPGSSIKGKMRSLVEWELGKVDSEGDPHACEDPNCKVCRIFGTSAEKGGAGPTRLIVRDAHPTEGTEESWEKLDTDLLYTEAKTENFLNRITSEAMPRTIERVPKDSEFDFEMVYSIYGIGDDGTTDVENLEVLLEAMRLLEDSALGASGSRGYGKIEFTEVVATVKSREDYERGDGGRETKVEDLVETAEAHLSA